MWRHARTLVGQHARATPATWWPSSWSSGPRAWSSSLSAACLGPADGAASTAPSAVASTDGAPATPGPATPPGSRLQPQRHTSATMGYGSHPPPRRGSVPLWTDDPLPPLPRLPIQRRIFCNRALNMKQIK
ncbi:hypothetical protein HYH03_019031, partial [Edaphochlamys debaryana]